METFATEIAKSLLGKLGSFAVQEFRLAWGLEDDLARLEERLKAINAVLSDAEKQQSKNDRIRLWLHMLREVLYDAEDVLDEIECETLRRQVVKTTGSTSSKVRRSLGLSSNKIAFRLRMGHKIKKIIERLAEISSLKSDFNLIEQPIDCGHVLHEETEMNRSFESFSGLIGRDEDKERIINLLVAPFKKRLPEEGIGCLECLQALYIDGCENLENLCEDMQGLRSLRRLVIAGCDSLISLPRSIKCLTTLEELFIINCEELDLMTIEEEIEEKIQPLSLSLRIVMFEYLPATIALPEQFLQGSAESLQTFIIRDCPNIEEIPDCIGNLKKLQNLEISDCPRLSKKCRSGTGEDWPKIKHIPKIKVADDDSDEETSHAALKKKTKTDKTSCVLKRQVQVELHKQEKKTRFTNVRVLSAKIFYDS
uniref:NBS-LRR resistance gene-like protein ARGH30 n=1 Tax=Populus alba TaxID=43335 RepID=A0A4U5QWE3_POPAL|nr:NBS-LRR resistance gene-like protein ARGH30 [Populus alba]